MNIKDIFLQLNYMHRGKDLLKLQFHLNQCRGFMAVGTGGGAGGQLPP